jgi:hypothetical protein
MRPWKRLESDRMKPSIIFASFALLAGLASAGEWWRSGKAKPLQLTLGVPLPQAPPPQAGRTPVSIGGLDAQAQRSGELNSRAALYSGIGVILSAIASILGSCGF